jgi:F420-non-reducing hydrogenase iron-sulfur subunit
MADSPEIILFQCQWCLYAPEDQDWVDHQLPQNVSLIKVPCTGRIDPLLVLNAVQGGAQGIMICGCIPENCHFKAGNLSARRQLDEFAAFLDFTGFDRQRVRFTWLNLQDRGRIQHDLSMFIEDVQGLPEDDHLHTRIPAPLGGSDD